MNAAPYFIGLLGLAFGSFANVAIYRMPRSLSIVAPGSKCPSCDTPIRVFDNIPVVSYLLLGGRCRSCRARISARYPVVELLVGILWLTAALFVDAGWTLPAMLAFLLTLVVLSAVDLEIRRIPHKILLPAWALGALLLCAGALIEGEPGRIRGAGLGLLIGAAPFFLLVLLLPGKMGAGDYKLSGYIGMHLGWFGLGAVAVALYAGVILGGLISAGLLALGIKKRKDHIPFGPFLAAGAVVALFFSDSLLALYLR